jgi:hypothetical protein
MQFNIYVPKGKVGVVQALERQAEKLGVAKSELMLQAAEEFLARRAKEPMVIPTFDLGNWKLPTRAELYEDRLNKSRLLEGR